LRYQLRREGLPVNRRDVLVSGFALALPIRASGSDSKAAVGKPAPSFRVSDTEGRGRQLSEFAGNAVVLEWTSPSCPFVRAQYQSGVMQELQQLAAKQGAVWLSVLSTHTSRRDYLPPDRAADFHRRRGAASTALLMDSDGTVGKAFGAVVTPHMFVIDGRGVLAYAGGAGDKSTMDPKEVRASRSFVRAALEDLAAGRKVAAPTSLPFGCTVAYQG
jgi:peroxiredoxin